MIQARPVLALLAAIMIVIGQASAAGAAPLYPQEGGRNGAQTFTDYRTPTGDGSVIDRGETVDVSCKIFDPTAAIANPGGYWYRIASAPWNGQYYAPANQFLNGDPEGGPYVTVVDTTVPDCFAPTNDFKYVALGDSFSAGEGVEPFWRGSNRCHRSIDAYPMFVEQPGVKGTSVFDRITGGGVDWGFQACSGATTANVLPRSLGGVGRYGDPVPQLELNRTRDRSRIDLPVDADTDLVTITIGGNNVHFADIVSFCATSADCTTAKYRGKLLLDYITGELNKLGPQLDRVYRQIHQQAPQARIIVAGYPQLFPESPVEQNCQKLAQRGVGNRTIGFSQKEQNFLRGQTSRLNQVIADRVNRATNAQFVPVDAIFQFHEVCGNSGEWINAPQLSRPSDGRRINPNSQSFHPNEHGQRLGYAAAINGALNGF